MYISCVCFTVVFILGGKKNKIGELFKLEFVCFEKVHIESWKEDIQYHPSLSFQCQQVWMSGDYKVSWLVYMFTFWSFHRESGKSYSV